MSDVPPVARQPWRRLLELYHRLLGWLLMISVCILIIPVSLQIFSRFELPEQAAWIGLAPGPLLPHYIWTEEMARFLFIWTIMIGAMIGVREGLHFEVDVWPRLRPRSEAAVRLVARLGVFVFALVFVGAGFEFTQFAWNRISELAELPLWLIHIAWPITGVTCLLFLVEQLIDDVRVLLRRGT